MSDKLNKGKYRVINSTTVEEFWSQLSPTGDLNNHSRRLIYRGQLDRNSKGERLGLLPTVLREKQQEQLSRAYGKSELGADEIVAMEALLLDWFCTYCDASGAQIPGDSPDFRRQIISFRNKDEYWHGKKLWPGEELDSVIAIAQHHGVPTRLLDWSKVSSVAAYFAASEAVAQREYWKEIKQLVVWVLDTEAVGLYRDRIRMVEVPGASSPHLAAQSGIFTVFLHNGQRGMPAGNPESLESILEGALTKVTLPIQESIRLLDLCERAGFCGARLFPSLDGAGKATMTKLSSNIAGSNR